MPVPVHFDKCLWCVILVFWKAVAFFLFYFSLFTLALSWIQNSNREEVECSEEERKHLLLVVFYSPACWEYCHTSSFLWTTSRLIAFRAIAICTSSFVLRHPLAKGINTVGQYTRFYSKQDKINFLNTPLQILSKKFCW